MLKPIGDLLPSGLADRIAALPPLEPKKYTCSTCRDLGFISVEFEVGHPLYGRAWPCSCPRGIEAKMDRAKFPDGYRCASVQVAAWAEKTEQQKTAMTVLDIMANSQEGFRTASGWRGALLCGPTGTGKTMLAARCVERAGWVRDALYVYWPALLRAYKESYSKDDSGPSIVLEPVLRCHLLILDDLAAGAQADTRSSIEVAEQIAEARTTGDQWTIVTTNLTPDQIGEQFSDRVASRLCNRLGVLPVTGPDRRVGG